MTADTSDNIVENIGNRITDLQKSYVLFQEKMQAMQHLHDKTIDHVLLQLIELLDLVDIFKKNNAGTAPNDRFLVKIERYLQKILAGLDTREITFDGNAILPGKTRVLETKLTTEGALSGTIADVCRKGYQRGDKVIRPADVIAFSIALQENC